MLIEEFTRCGIIFDLSDRKLIDVQNIFHKMEQRTLAAAYKFYCDKDLTNAHTAPKQIHWLRMKYCFPNWKNMIRWKTMLTSSRNLVQSHEKCGLAGRIVFNEKGEEVFNFGKYKGKLVKEVFKTEPSYYDWMMKGDFATNTKM